MYFFLNFTRSLYPRYCIISANERGSLQNSMIFLRWFYLFDLCPDCALTCALTCALRQVGFVCGMDIDAECRDCIHVKLCGRIAVILQHFLHTGNTTVELVDIFHHSHGFCHERVAIVIDRREVFRTSFAIQSTGIHHFDVVIKLIKTDRHIGLVIPVHTGVHQQFTDCPFRVVPDSSFPEKRFRNGSLGYDTIPNK